MEVQRLIVLMLAAGMSVATLPVSAAAPAQTPTSASATKASAKPRVQGTVPAGKAAIVSSRATGKKRTVERRPLRPSEGQLAGLHRADDPLDLKSSVALVVNQDTDEVLFEKNTHAVLPIASITKLMTALVTVEANLPLDEELVVSQAELVRAGIRSNLRPGHETDARHGAAPGADVVGEPGGAAARSHLSRRARRLRRGHERQGAHARHERFPLRRSHRTVTGESLERQRPRAAGEGRVRARSHPVSTRSVANWRCRWASAWSVTATRIA